MLIRLLLLLFLPACLPPVYVVPVVDDWCEYERSCCCRVEECIHAGKATKCAYVRSCSREEIDRCVERVY